MTVPDDFTGGFNNPTPPPPPGAPPGWNQQQQQGYGAPQGYGGPVYSSGPQNGMGIAALVLGLLALLLGLFIIGGLFGAVAIGLGFAGRGRVKQGLADNKGVATAGIITGLIGILLACLTVTLLVVGTVSFLHSNTVKDIRQCLSNDKSQQAACERKLGISPTPSIG
ncbi:hypothetical protein acdb102_13830 [Acidothermaceae bacterium B102]|nr:hypothetical protein acdb102_13830 [Acidothermaceae bacterium B102]